MLWAAHGRVAGSNLSPVKMARLILEFSTALFDPVISSGLLLKKKKKNGRYHGNPGLSF